MNYLTSLTRPFVLFGLALSLVLLTLAGPATASDDLGLAPTSSDLEAPAGDGTVPEYGGSDSSDAERAAAMAGDAYIFREHPTANNERVDLFEERIEKVHDQHNVRFDALVRTVEWARSPRKATSNDGVDRGIYQYRIYEYLDGDKTGRWVIIQSVIEWGDGKKGRGWLVTAYPVRTQAGAPAKRDGKSWAPAWLSNSFVFGPINNDRLYN